MDTHDFNEVMLELLDEYHIASEALTRDQLARCILQALECGDFTSMVCQAAGSQAIVYLPFAETERLRSRIKLLEEKLTVCGLYLP